MRKIFLSAHPDDAVLSCGGYIYDDDSEGVETEVWTFMCAIPAKQPPEGFLKRISEDTKAVRMLGAKPVHKGYLDALYREKKDGSRIYASVFDPMDPQDEGLIESVAKIITMNLRPEDRIMCPLAVGEHVDHTIMRRAAESLQLPLTYYTDFPYIEYVPEKLDAAIVGLEKFPNTITPRGLTEWLDAACAYESQQLYPTREITRLKIIEYWSKINGIFLWKREEE